MIAERLVQTGDRREPDDRSEVAHFRGHPEGEVSARRVSEHDGTRGVSAVLRRMLAGEVHSALHVIERARPAATGLADAAVFDIGGRESGRGEGRAHRSGMHQIVADAPEATVNHDGQRPDGARGGTEEIDELAVQVAVAKALAGGLHAASQSDEADLQTCGLDA